MATEDPPPPASKGWLATISSDVVRAPSVLGWTAAGAALGYGLGGILPVPGRFVSTGLGLVVGFFYGEARAFGIK